MFHAFGSVSFFMVVFVPTRGTVIPVRPKRVKLATVWCEYADRDAVVADFKANNKNLRACDLQVEFALRESMNCAFDS